MGVSTELAIVLKGEDKTADAFRSVSARAANVNRASRDYSSIDNIMNRMDKYMKRLAFVGKATAIYYGAERMYHWIYKSLDTMQRIRASSEKIGLETDRFQKLQVVLSQVGILGDELAELVFPKMQRALTDPKVVENLETLKVNINQIREMNPEDQFIELGAAISKIPSEAERMRVAFELFGRQGFRFAPLWRVGPDQFKKGFREMMVMAPAAANSALASAEMAFKGIEYVQAAFKNAIYNGIGVALTWVEKKFGGLDTAIAIGFETLHMWGKAFVEMCSSSAEALGMLESDFASTQDRIGTMWVRFVVFLGNSLAAGLNAASTNAWNSVELGFRSLFAFAKMNWRVWLPGNTYKQEWENMLTEIGNMSEEAAKISEKNLKRMVPDFGALIKDLKDSGVSGIADKFQKLQDELEEKKRVIVAGMAAKEMLMKQTAESSSEMILETGKRAAGILANQASYLDAASYELIKARFRRSQGDGVAESQSSKASSMYNKGDSSGKDLVSSLLSQIKQVLLLTHTSTDAMSKVLVRLEAV